MSRKHRIVHLISLIAIMVSLFTPILSLPVTADEPPPEPDVTLTTGEDGTAESQQPAGNPEVTEVVAPVITNEPATEPAETEVVVEEPPLTAVAPAPPVLSDAACAEGVVYSQSAVPAVTEGVSYELSSPDAAGNFIVTATLTDTSVYTWADSGLEGWEVNGSQATSSYTLTLCPIPEPTATETIQQPPAEVSTPEPEATEPTEEIVGSDSSTAASASTPSTSASRDVAILAEAGLTYDFSTDRTSYHTGEKITLTIVIANPGTGPVSNYHFTTDLSIGTDNTDVVRDAQEQVIKPSDSSCGPPQFPNVFDCTFNDVGSGPLQPGSSHTYTVEVLVQAPTGICIENMMRGGGDVSNFAPGNRYGDGATKSIFIEINCDSEPAPLLSLTLTDDIVMGSTAFLNQPFIYTVTVTNPGNIASDGYEFQAQLPDGVVLFGDTPISSPEGTTCTPQVVDGRTTIACSGTSVPAGSENSLMFNFVVMPVDMIDGELTSAACGSDTMLSIAGGITGQWDPNAQLANLVTLITCESAAEYTLEPLESPVSPGGTIGFVHTILNTGQTHITNAGPSDSTLPALPAGYEWIVTFEINGEVYDQLPPNMAVGPGGTFKVFITSPTIPEDMPSPDNEWCTDWTMSSTFGVRFSTGEMVNPSDSTTVQVVCDPELTIAKTNSTNGTIAEGENFNYSVTVTNSGTSISGNYAFSDPLPAGIQLQEGASIVTPAGATCTPTTIGGVTTINCSGTGISSNNGQHSFTFPVVANADLSESVCGSVTNTIVTGTGVWAQQPPASSTINITCHAPLLTYEIEADKQHANVGEEITFTITVTNVGTADSGVYLFMTELSVGGYAFVHKDPWDVIQPANIQCRTEQGATAFICSNAAGVPLAPTESHVFTVTTVVESTNVCGQVQSRGGGDGNDALWAEGSRYRDPGPSFYTSINCDSELSIAMTNSPATAVDIGDDFNYDITVTNVGSSVSGNYTITDRLPNGVVLNESNLITTPTGASCIPDIQSGATTITCNGGGIAANGTHNFSISVTASAAPENHVCGNVINTVNGGTGAWNPDMKSASSTLSFNCPSLELSYTSSLADGAKLGLGEEATITISVTNTGTMDSGAFGFRFVLLPSLVPTDQMDARCEVVSSDILCAGSGLAMGDGGSDSFAITVKAVEGGDDTCAPLGLNYLVEGTSPGIWSDEADSLNVNVTINCVTLVTFTHEAESTQVLPGENIVFVTTVKNDGNTLISGLILDFPMLPDLPGDATWNQSWFRNGEIWVPTTDPLEPGEWITIRTESPVIPEDASAADSEWCADFNTTSSYTANSIDSPSLQGSGFASVLVNCTDLVIDQQVSSLRVELGGTVTYTLTVTNNGNLAISPVQLFFDTNQAGTAFSGWNISSESAAECWVDESGLASCWYESLAPAQPAVVTITADAVAEPTWQQCAAVTTSAYALYGEVLAPTQMLAKVTPPYTEIYSNQVTTQLDCAATIALEITSASDPGTDGRMDEGDIITFTYVVTNPGNLPLYDIDVTGTPEGLDWTNGSTIAELPAGDQATLTATYAITSADLDAGSVAASSQVSAVTVAGSTIPEETVGATAQLEVTLPQESGVSIDVTTQIDEGDNNRVDAGDIVTITVDIINGGNVTIYDLAVTSDLSGLNWTEDPVIAELPAGEGATFTATYAISQDDIDSGFLEHTTKVDGIVMLADDGVARLQVFGLAQAQLAPMLSEPVSGEVTERIELAQVAGIELEVTSVPETGNDDVLDLNETITYTFTVTNTGNVTLTGIEVASGMEGVTFTNGSTIASLAPGAEGELTATYTVTQADVDAGTISTCADVTAMDSNNAVVSDLDACVTDTVAQPVTPEPVTPAPPTPGPTNPEPTTPEAVTGLPETGSGSIISIAPVLWAAMLGVVALGVGAIGSRKRFR